MVVQTAISQIWMSVFFFWASVGPLQIFHFLALTNSFCQFQYYIALHTVHGFSGNVFCSLIYFFTKFSCTFSR